MSDDKRKAIISQYLSDNGIKANSKGYKALYFAILEASYHPELGCLELFEAVSSQLSKENGKPVDGRGAYRNAHYSIKNSKKGSYDGGPYDFIKSCSVKLESM